MRASTNTYSPIRGCKIIIFKRSAERRSALLSVYEAMAVNFAHEIEHTTNKNLGLQFNKSSEKLIETEPDNITSTAALIALVNFMVHSNSNIQVEFKN